MAPVQGDDTGSQNCSCTSCFYKSESEHPSVRKMMAQGSRIDKLYIGKYIPLREYKLLDKLVRTRAVYDDVRNQLLSGSSININKKADLKPKKKTTPPDKELDDIGKSGAILELVDLVDKGVVLGPKTISECCSCCFCSSNALLPEHATKRRRHRHGHRHRHEHVHGHRHKHGHRHGDTRESSNASDVSGHGIGMESRRDKNLKIVAKQIRSDPCTCSIKLSGMIKRRSKAMLKKLRADRHDPMLDESYDSEWADTRQHRWQERRAKLKKSLRGIKQTREIENEISKFRLVESLAKVNRSKAKMRNNLETGAKRSLEKIKSAKMKMKDDMKTRIKESLQKIKPISEHIKSNMEENIFKLKKDSITKFREKLDRKRQLKKNKIQTARRHKHEKSSGDMSNVSDISVQARKMEVTTKAGTKKQELMSRKIESIKVAPEQRVSIDLSIKKGGIKQEMSSPIQEKGTKSKGIGKQEITTKKQEKATKPKGVGKQEITTKKQEKGTKPKSVGKQEITTKNQEKGTVISARKGKEELSTQIQEKRIKSKGVNKQDITTSINEKLKTPKSVMSVPSVQSKTSKHSTSSMTSANEKKNKELKKPARKSSSVSSVAKKPARISSKNENIVEKNSDEHGSSHQAVKIGSSFSFNIEFSKDKPSSKTNAQENIPSIKHKVKTRHKGQGQIRQTNHHNKYADARYKQLAKDTQAGLALKRCFCTLKLKPKRTKLKATKSKLVAANMASLSESVTESVQTKKEASMIKDNPSQLTYELLPYECEPFVCIPGECNPIECEKRIKKRGRKHHTARTNTNYNMKSTPSLTSRSISSATSKRIQVSSPNKPKKAVSSISNLTSIPVDSSQSHKQVVRISSSFSFNIEFHKDRTSNASEDNNDLRHNQSKAKEPPIKRRKNKSVDHVKQHIKHKRSQMSSSTGKSKYTITKHSLRRCFCTLKLAKTDKNRMRGKQLSKSTLTSSKKIKQIRSVQPEVMSRSIATDKETARKRPRCKLLPYECEPGICEPGYCNPYDCLEVIKRRNVGCLRRRHIQSNTDYRKIRSTSSLTSRSVIHSKAKKIQSTLAAYKTEVPVHYMKKNTAASREVETLPSSPNKQTVRIGSSFSFDIEFFKDKSLPTSNTPVDNIQEQKLKKKERGLQGNMKRHHKSTVMKKEERSVLIGPAMKRCFCTLKLHKIGKDKRSINTTDTGTETPKFKNKVYPKVDYVSKATKTNSKLKHTRRLEPYECEPNFCVPGECDPYECLERIKKRDVESREFGISTNRSKLRTTPSITQKLSSRSKKIHVQTKEKKNKSVKSRQLQKAITPSQQSKKSLNIVPAALSRQAVRIGSNFSFDIQFKKDFSGIMDEDNILSVKSFNRSMKKLKNRGENPWKVAAIQRESQSEMPKKQNRATDVGRMLKRCFCTLKLQNAQKKQRRNNQTFTHLKSPKIYAVSRISVADNKLIRSFITEPNSVLKFNDSVQSYLHETKESTFLDQSYNQTVMKRTLQLNSNITSRVMFSKQINDFDVFNNQGNIKTESQLSTQRYWKKTFNNFDSLENQNSQIIDANSNTSNINGFSQYLNRRFCTMNIQVPGREKSNKKKSSTDTKDSRAKAKVRNKRHKLEPYECEPGVCIPYECDPIECQKRIMSRLKKGVSKMSGTDVRSKSSSSHATFSTPNLKGKKIQSNKSRPARALRETRQGITYETVPTTRRQAVRVGSKFSFDIEFSKNRSQSSVRKTNKPKHSKKKLNAVDTKLKTIGTSGSGNSRHHIESQSMVMKLHDRASNITPILKRCFCTLKLQKKGKHQQERTKKVDQGTVTPPNTRQEIVKTRYLNAEQNTSSQRAHKLLPYECEPNVCVPGECNPYECLELIKRRKVKTKHSGTDSGRSISTSSSMSNQKKKNKGKHVQSNFKHKPKIKNLKKGLPSKSIVTYATKPHRQSRQAVRVGSCFSFDVEFYKDRKYHGDQDPNRHLKYVSKPRENKLHEHKSKQVMREKNIKERSSQDSKTYTHKNSQMEGLAKHTKSSMTSALIKRCFCTLKAFKPVKKQAATASTETEAIMQQNNIGKDIAIQHGRKYRPPPQLDPNECEPGICIPDACDPYVCEQIIKKRNAKYDSKTTGTERIVTKSVSSSSKPPKLKQAKSQPERAPRNVKPRPEKATRKVKPKTSQDYSTSETFNLPMSTNRQAVRIGSTFSFDIEFYKEKSPHYRQVQAAAKAIKEKPHRKQLKSHEVNTKPKTNKAETQKEISLHSRDSQAQTIKQKNQGSGVGPLLKRCFCTLKLKKQENTEISVKKMIPNVQTKSVMTVANKKPIKYSLKPYECEPGICIPGECDPYECDKLIQKRNRRDSSTTMGHQTTKSTSSWAKSSGKNKSKNMQFAGKNKKRRKYNGTSTKTRQPKKSKVISNKKMSKQAVKIGSNFSFNVEFFKDKSYGSRDIHPRLPKMQYDTKESTNNTSTKRRHQKSQLAKTVRHMDSQVFAKKIRSTMTGVSPFLKRCFCTLKLHKEDNKKQINTETSSTEMQQLKLDVNPPIGSTNKGTYINKTPARHSPRNLEPYECEPGVCVPNECNPYECEKRIRKRLMRSQYSSTDRPKGHSVSVLSSDSVSSSVKKNQATYHPREPKYRKTKKDVKKYQRKEVRPSKASSNKQAVKIGSNFSFNVEFFKDRSQLHNGRAPDTYKYPSVNDKKIKMKEVATKLKTRNSAAFREGINLHNRYSQAEGARTESKSSGMGPLLKRCFCTLKLQNAGTNQKQSLRKDVKGTTITRYSPVIEARNVKIRTAIGRKIRPLEPYECEPNVCVPGKCDPLECEKRIKRRMKELGMRTVSSDMKSTSSSTSQGQRRKSKASKTRYSKQAKRKSNYDKNKYSYDIPDLGRQSVGFNSNFSFNVEFFKDRTQHHNDINKKQSNKKNILPSTAKEKHHNSINKKQSNKKYILPSITKEKHHNSINKKQSTKKNILSSTTKEKHHNSINKKQSNEKIILPSTTKEKHHNSINKKQSNEKNILPSTTKEKHPSTRKQSEIKEKETKTLKATTKCSVIGSLVKRCFCTLTLQKNTGLLTKKESNHSKPPKVSMQCKATSTKMKENPRVLDPYECEPLSCIPGECDPQECLKRIKKRGIRRISRTTGTHTRRSSQISVSNMITPMRPQQKSKRMQASIIRKNDGISMVVEQPRFPLNRRAVKFGSNISFNIELYKEYFPFAEPFNELDSSDVKQKNRVPKDRNPNGSSLKHKNVSGKSLKFHNTESQVGVKTENKSSKMGNALKRCFCTAKLHKPSTPQTKCQNSPNVNAANPSVSQKSPFFKPVQCYFQFQHPNKVEKETNNKKTTTNNLNQHHKCKCKTEQKLPSFKEKNDGQKMETILPYTPSKFKKSVSKSVLPLQKEDGKRKPILKNKKQNVLEDEKTNNQSIASKTSKNRRLTAKKGKKSIKTKPMDTITSKSNPLHELICRCKHIFTKQNKATPSNVINTSDVPKANKNKNDVGPQAEPCTCSKNIPADTLKISKSERTAKNLKTSSEPKKSKSLKGAKVSKQHKCSNECRYKIQEKRKFSIFQGGDAEQTHLKVSKKNKDKQHRKDFNKNVQFSQISSPKSIKQIQNKIPDLSQEKKSNRPYKKCLHCSGEKKSHNFKDNINSIPSKMSSFVSRCFCKLCKMTKDNLKQMNDANQRKAINQKKLQKIELQGKGSKTCPDCNKIKKKKNANKTPLSSGDGLATPVPSLTRPSMTNGFSEKAKQPRKSMPVINISGSKVKLPNSIVPSYRNKKSPVLIKSIHFTNIDKNQKNHLPVIKISNDIITYPESLLLSNTPSTNRNLKSNVASKPFAKLVVKPKKNSCICGKKLCTCGMKPCTCGNLTCAELSKQRHLEEQEEKRKSALNTKPCVCGSLTCAKETKKRLLDAEKKAKKLKVPKCVCKSLVCANEAMKRLKQEKKLATEGIPDAPCICGSSVCAKEKKRLLELRKEKNKVTDKAPCTCKFPPCEEERKRLLEKEKDKNTKKSVTPCICGSKVCDIEAKKMLESKLKSKNKSNGKKKHPKNVKGMTAEQLKEYKKRQKEYSQRLKRYRKEDAITRKKRKKENRYMDEQVTKYRNRKDSLKLAESALDVSKLTCNVASDILRCTYRTITDREHAKAGIKTAVKYPKRACDYFKKAVIDTGALSTQRRLGRRCASMKKVKLLKRRLEENAVTNFLLHATDQDPKKRFNKKKKAPQRTQREPLDFGCSLYMASLRRRPHLSVYYMCPWFYPHFISMMTVLRQFIDIILFLLAVCVWSPCIVGMEMCRAMMCCFFCTG